MNYNNNTEYPNKIRKIENTIFILNMDNLDNYYSADPDELIIVYSSYEYSQLFMQTIIKTKPKLNVKKIITSDSIIIKYIGYMENTFKNIFPNCNSIQINSLENDFNLILRIIDEFEIIKNIEYTINDYALYSNSLLKYNYFTQSIFTGNLLNIKYIKIINNILIEPKCSIQKKIIDNLINFDLIEKNNKLQLESIKKYNISSKSINHIYFEYINKRDNKYYYTNIINTINIDFLSLNFEL